jgi:long-chain-fatty-acyl-CoA reductase
VKTEKLVKSELNTTEVNRVLKLPFVIHGKAIKSDANDEQFIHANCGKIVLPSLKIFLDNFQFNQNQLCDISTQDIIGFFFRVGKMWENEEYIRRRMYIRQMCELIGYSEKMAIAEADLISVGLKGSARLWETIQIDLGDRHILDRWVRREDCDIKAFPKGYLFHILSGNTPIAVLLSILRSIITKNQTILKVASGDAITPTQIALSFLDIDPNHPVSKSIHTVYWPSNSEIGAAILKNANGVCVWGGTEALAWVHQNTSPGVEIVSFGPKRSFSIVNTNKTIDINSVARLVAHDICMYDQGACFSTQNIFVIGNAELFAEKLADALQKYDNILPVPSRNSDLVAGALLTRLHNEFLGNKIYSSQDNSWHVICCSMFDNIRHPGARIAFVTQIQSIDEIYKFVDSSVQTVGVYPWEISQEIKDQFSNFGISRIVESGSSGIYRLGGTHDGIYPLTRFVRFVSVEAPSSVHPKGMTIPLNMSKIIENRQFRDLFL